MNNVKKFNIGSAAAQGKQPGGFAAGMGAIFNITEQLTKRSINPIEMVGEENTK